MREINFFIWILVFACVIGTLATVYMVYRMRKRGDERRRRILDCIANNSDLAVLIYFPKKKRVEFVSDSVSWLFGINKEQVYQDARCLFKPLRLSGEDDIVKDFFEGSIQLSNQMEYTAENYRDGSKRWFMVRTAPCGNGRVILTVADVTVEHKLVETLRILLQESKEGNQAKPELLSYVGEQIQSRMQEMTTVYQQFLDLVNGVVVTDDSPGVVGMNAAFDIRQLMQEMADSFRQKVEHKGQTFELNCSIIHNHVFGDRDKLKKVIQNLLENAVIYTPHGGKVTLSIEEENAVKKTENRMVAGFTIVVEDTGIGISEEFIPKLFQPFERADDPRVKEVGGRGLGLVLVTNIIDWMNGSIYVESKMEHGSRFIVNLDFAIPDVERAVHQK